MTFSPYLHSRVFVDTLNKLTRGNFSFHSLLLTVVYTIPTCIRVFDLANPSLWYDANFTSGSLKGIHEIRAHKRPKKHPRVVFPKGTVAHGYRDKSVGDTVV